jgi:hypothetical protein
VARVLHESGVRLGNDLAEATEDNVEGFYEELPVVLLHERMLGDLRMSGIWHAQSLRWAGRATVLSVAERYRDEMAALAAGALDGWKDPRFSITLEAWLPFLQKPKVVVCLRSPEAYAHSVQRVFGLVELEAARRQWARHYRRLLAVIRDYQLGAICVEYDALIERPTETVAALSAFIGRPLRAEYVDAPLRCHVRPVPERYRGLYKRALRLSGVRDQWPWVRDEGDGVAQAFGQLMAPWSSAPARSGPAHTGRARPAANRRGGEAGRALRGRT